MTESEIIKRLDKIQADLRVMKHHVVDPDCILTEDDLDALAEAERDLAAGRTTRLA